MERCGRRREQEVRKQTLKVILQVRVDPFVKPQEPRLCYHC